MSKTAVPRKMTHAEKFARGKRMATAVANGRSIASVAVEFMVTPQTVQKHFDMHYPLGKTDAKTKKRVG